METLIPDPSLHDPSPPKFVPCVCRPMLRSEESTDALPWRPLPGPGSPTAPQAPSFWPLSADRSWRLHREPTLVLRPAGGVSPVSAPRSAQSPAGSAGLPPDFVQVEISLSLIAGRLYQPSDEDSASERLSHCIRFLRVSPRPSRGVWEVRGQQSFGKSHPPPASLEGKNGGWIRSQAPSVSASALPPAAARHVICDTSVGVINPPCLEASLLSLKGPLLCRRSGSMWDGSP